MSSNLEADASAAETSLGEQDCRLGIGRYTGKPCCYNPMDLVIRRGGERQYTEVAVSLLRGLTMLEASKCLATFERRPAWETEILFPDHLPGQFCFGEKLVHLLSFSEGEELRECFPVEQMKAVLPFLPRYKFGPNLPWVYSVADFWCVLQSLHQISPLLEAIRDANTH